MSKSAGSLHKLSTLSAKTDNSAPSHSRTFPWQLRPMGGSISGEFPMKNLLVIPSEVWSLPRPWPLLDVFAPLHGYRWLQYFWTHPHGANAMSKLLESKIVLWLKCPVCSNLVQTFNIQEIYAPICLLHSISEKLTSLLCVMLYLARLMMQFQVGIFCTL
jgi:hypothetical protein